MTCRTIVLGTVLAGGAALALVSGAGGASSPGDPTRGQAVFAAKQCGSCHLPGAQGPGLGPALEVLRRPQGAYELCGRLWNHAPAMLAHLAGRGIEWPVIDAAEMEDLMAYLGADPARDPTPNLQVGQVTLLRKGCLKCHSLRGEGAHLAPELARSRVVADPPATWAARMWRHTPMMATKAQELGILYPRFAAHEMTHLIGFLRNMAALP